MNHLKLSTEVDPGIGRVRIGRDSRILVLGSCFADEVGRKMQEGGLDVTVNPFGTLYNPVSVANTLARIASGIPFGPEDCIGVGAGSGLIGSTSCHTLLARPSAEEFLQVAGCRLEEAAAFYKDCDIVIVTLGTAWVYIREGSVVANCLKRPAQEYERKFLDVQAVQAVLSSMVRSAGGRKFIFTVSPIRHLKDTAHGNQLSKSTLLLAVEHVVSSCPELTEYFPAYETVLDELRDYRFYARDLVHPSELAVDIVWERFMQFAFEPETIAAVEEAQKRFHSSQHRPLLHTEP